MKQKSPVTGLSCLRGAAISLWLQYLDICSADIKITVVRGLRRRILKPKVVQHDLMSARYRAIRRSPFTGTAKSKSEASCRRRIGETL